VTTSRTPRVQIPGAVVQAETSTGQGFDPQELLTPAEVCALLKMKRTWFYAEVARGALRPLKLGRSTRVRRRDLESYLSSLERAG
jgi:excisionase family DNA binding protein